MTDLSKVEWSDLINEIGKRLGQDAFDVAVNIYNDNYEDYFEDDVTEKEYVSMMSEYVNEGDFCENVTNIGLREYHRLCEEKYGK